MEENRKPDSFGAEQNYKLRLFATFFESITHLLSPAMAVELYCLRFESSSPALAGVPLAPFVAAAALLASLFALRMLSASLTLRGVAAAADDPVGGCGGAAVGGPTVEAVEDVEDATDAEPGRDCRKKLM